MKNTKFKDKAIKLVMPIAAASTLVYATTTTDYTPGHYIIITGNSPTPSLNYNVQISGGSSSYHIYKPGQEVNPFQNYNQSQWEFNNSYSSNILSIANLLFGGGASLYGLNLMNPGALTGVFGNIASLNTFGQLALPAALYIIGTYTPILKEAVTAADNISKQMAMFTNQALGSIQNAINSLPNGVRQAVQACISYNVSGGLTGLSLNTVENYLSNGGQAALNNVVDNCIQGEDLLAEFNYNPATVNQYLNQFNPRAWMISDIQQAGLVQNPQDGNLYASATVNPSNNLISLFNPQLVAKDMLIASQPAVQYNPNLGSGTVGAIVPQYVYITLPNNSKLLVSLANFNEVTKAITAEQMYYTLTSFTNATDFDSYYNQYVVPVNNALSITSQDFYNYWYTLYKAIQTYEYAYEHGGRLPWPHDDVVLTQPELAKMEEQLQDTISKLTNLYTAYFRKDTLAFLQQDAQENEEELMAKKELNHRPGSPPPPTPANQNSSQQSQSPPPPQPAGQQTTELTPLQYKYTIKYTQDIQYG